MAPLLQSTQYLLILFCFFVFLSASLVAESRTLFYKWEVKYEIRSPDCFKKLTITINGGSPGPTIYAHQGDNVIVELKNSLASENVAVHWHGIRQIGTPWSDGTEGVTQCPVLPGETFKYQFVVDRAGTYLYHAHYGMQRQDGLYGSIVVWLPEGQSEPFSYDHDRNLILTDWYHKSSHEHATGLATPDPGFQWVGEPDSLLIQGRGRFKCSLLGSSGLASATCNSSSPQCVAYPLTVVPGKTYRLRVSSLTSLSALSFQIESHTMTVVEADGHYVEPFQVNNLFIYSGETYSVLIKADQDPSRNYWATTNVVSRPRTTPPGLAIFNYYPNHRRKLPPTTPPAGPAWNDVAPRLAQSHAIKARQGFIHPPPKIADKVIVLLNTQNTVKGRRRWSLNNVSFNMPHTPYLIALKHNLLHTFSQAKPPTGYDFKNYDIFNPAPNQEATESDAIFRLEFKSTVDIILQNANMMSPNSSDTHPWHLHGHDFWVLGYGEGKFDIYRDPSKYNLENPIMKNTVALHPYGWTALRFVADNPGVWAFHCHIDAHFFMGMGVVFEEGIDQVGNLPTSIMGCGESKRFLRP
ncbi:L-ascorbate oxidase-like [Cucurbita moschata]|uniref:L-ascorbate oxidase n=1 Tax=Cucurbita moschata TaxID=3662 RepID=A0A6J1GE53_CUCMO|nr:L-ascorbate oxidase-like [Cucurbita moschata]XP_022949917.1 L-ascorbate oxidase-like [Cucurbita moschata]XP_022949918.1 L-ascorbate oxidase-like [Cucurbita moschata]XP_022949919.1 L-ascorbate oxidase-like [Cucurbita moschata]XP_022949920.1 L-ascorbate oxidase-like [Cucurbita moschata]XP_022949921.1 L-ascorbate oxidase-like [Cucurbita moschata]